jgi:hypothetical protein
MRLAYKYSYSLVGAKFVPGGSGMVANITYRVVCLIR